MAYHVVLVKFEGRGRVYPVNGPPYLEAGVRVVVQMADASQGMLIADVVDHSFSKEPCRHSIVGREGDPHCWLPHPDTVTSSAQLLKYMHDHNMRRWHVVNETGGTFHGNYYTFAYTEAIVRPNELEGYVHFSSPVLYFNDSDAIAVERPSGNSKIMTKHFGGKVLMPWGSMRKLDPDNGCIFQQAARIVRGDLICLVDKWTHDGLDENYDITDL